MSFDQLAQTCERVAATPSRNRKVALLGAYFGELDEANLVRAVRFLTGQPLPGEKLSLGHAALRGALIEATGWDLETVRLCYREVGDTGETIGLLLHAATKNLPLTLEQAEQEYLRIFAARIAATANHRTRSNHAHGSDEERHERATEARDGGCVLHATDSSSFRSAHVDCAAARNGRSACVQR